MTHSKIVLQNVQIIDVNHPTPSQFSNVVIKGDKITAITTEPVKDKTAQYIDLKGHYLLPGLIDNHVHLTASQFDLADTNVPDTYLAIQAKDYLEKMLQRGFTSVRDAGGAGYGLELATEQGLIKGPRLFRSGKAISQTGGHGDFQKRSHMMEPCLCHKAGSSISTIADGVDAMRKAVREQLRQGASQIKIMASGGVASPTDNIHNVQFSEEEIQTAVAEARHSSTYVMAHAYTPRAIQRCVKNGVRSIEHGNLIDRTTARMMREHGAFMVPTMVIYYAIAEIGRDEGFPEKSVKKVSEVLANALQAVEIARAEGVSIGFGTDLLGPRAHAMQSEEFNIRIKGIESAHDIICSATAVNAEILQQADELGVVKVGAYADLIAVDGNPLDDIKVLTGQGEHINMVMKAGKIFKNHLQSSSKGYQHE